MCKIIATVWKITLFTDTRKYLHYSKIQIFVQKFNFDKTPTFLRVFHQNFFWQFFSWNQSCQQLKSPKPQHFHEFFTQIKSTIFTGNQSWIFGQKMKISNSVILLSKAGFEPGTSRLLHQKSTQNARCGFESQWTHQFFPCPNNWIIFLTVK
mgnify:CR=1 FL=1